MSERQRRRFLRVAYRGFDLEELPPSICIEWRGSVNEGFPIFGKLYARRLAALCAGMSVGMHDVVETTCGERMCVRPTHLRVVPRALHVANTGFIELHGKAARLMCRGYSYARAAKALGVSASWVWKWFGRGEGHPQVARVLELRGVRR